MPLPLKRIRELLAPTYTIDRELGRGGMATVCLAQDTKHERVVALKGPKADLALYWKAYAQNRANQRADFT